MKYPLRMKSAMRTIYHHGVNKVFVLKLPDYQIWQTPKDRQRVDWPNNHD